MARRTMFSCRQTGETCRFMAQGGFRFLYAFVVLHHHRRRILSVAVTLHPTAEWIARQVTEAFPWQEAPRYLIRDRDAAYGLVVRRRLAAMGIRDRPIAARSPGQNAYVERLIGSIRRECLDHILVFGERHLRTVLKSYAGYHNRVRTHLSLDKDAPFHRAAHCTGQIVAIPILGGLHHHYVPCDFQQAQVGVACRGDNMKAADRVASTARMLESLHARYPSAADDTVKAAMKRMEDAITDLARLELKLRGRQWHARCSRPMRR